MGKLGISLLCSLPPFDCHPVTEDPRNRGDARMLRFYLHNQEVDSMPGLPAQRALPTILKPFLRRMILTFAGDALGGCGFCGDALSPSFPDSYSESASGSSGR